MFEARLVVVKDGKERHRRSPHATRHTTASIWIEMGLSAKRVQVMMGHSSIQITFDLYGHLIDLNHSDTELMKRIDQWVIDDPALTSKRDAANDGVEGHDSRNDQD